MHKNRSGTMPCSLKLILSRVLFIFVAFELTGGVGTSDFTTAYTVPCLSQYSARWRRRRSVLFPHSRITSVYRVGSRHCCLSVFIMSSFDPFRLPSHRASEMHAGDDDNDDLPGSSKTHAALTRLPVIPDLRFEQSYLRSIAAYVHVSPGDETHAKDAAWRRESGEVAALPSPAHRVVSIDWGNVVWVTARDQVLSPLLQGALWGVASQYLRPLLSLAGAQFRSLFNAGGSKHLPSREGSGTGWLRERLHGLGLGFSSFGKARL
ncbi:hypothetical protein PLICRDRAFT_358975 [Plicaturopsis crispa FD-325 SS-3]|uniref:Uncharacterized protein n=1 Tax=Plicaturopsis crispa FD-325 SS-3 TaxID=944288 RepID=A0A0C9T805_PLICR|nr:hypothetical protein PLICRDRAFT_358975 [Plicaturopsis crispa FD-325 SS-3]